MATAASVPSGMTSRPTYSCVRCAERKVKCDRQRPCSNCVKHHVDCVFNASRPPRKQRRRVNDQILTDRLRRYEALLRDQGFDPSKLPDAPDPGSRRMSSHTAPLTPEEARLQTPASIESEPNNSFNKTQLVQGQGRSQLVDNYIWTRVVEEFHNPEDALEDSSNDPSDLEASDDDFGFVLSSRPISRTRSRHPPPEHIHQLWQIFVENVDPLTKIVHAPTLQLAIQKAASNIEAVPRGFEALMFAIYGAAVMSLKDDECRQRFYEPRKTLLSRFLSATQAALSRAKFMGALSLVVLQALVIHLISVRDIYEPRTVWSLTGVALRIAQNMGLERDGSSLGLPPFESEMRRRIWWLLKTHDYRTAELCGHTKFQDLDICIGATSGPTNLNDNQLYPGMPSLPVASKSLTDVVFMVVRHELTSFAAGRVAKFRREGKAPQKWDLASLSDKPDMEEAFTELEEVLETKHLRYCDPSQPLHLMTMLMARAAVNNVRFLTHHPRRWASLEQTPLSERELIWEISIKTLEQHTMLQSNPQLKQFAWQAAFALQWHAFIHVLDTLRANPLIPDAEKAWRLVSHIYENNSDMVLDTRRPIHVAVGNLCLKAYSAREAALQTRNMYFPPTPECILQLRQQREVAKAKRQARNSKTSRPEDKASYTQANARDTSLRDDAEISYPSEILDSTHLHQSTMPQPSSLTQRDSATEGDPFWFINGFDDSQVGHSADMMDIDLDFMLDQDQSVEDNTLPTITWEQWDAWLADSNKIPPLSSARDLRTGT